MKQREFAVLLAVFLFVSSSLFAADISYDLSRDVAYHKTVSVFGDHATIGEGIPYYDLNDNLMGYEFAIALYGKIPNEGAVLEMVREKTAFMNEYIWQNDIFAIIELDKERAGIGKYGNIFVSANSSDYPVPEYGEGLPQYFLKYDDAKEYAWSYLENEPILMRMYYLTPYLKWYKFVANGKELFVRMHGSRCTEPEDIFSFSYERDAGADILEARHNQLWEGIRGGDFSVLDGERAGYIDSVPEFSWSYGCSPTASAMLLGYWDERGYDRLLDWYWNHIDPCTQRLVWNMPNVQQELAIAMDTDTNPSSPGCGGTSIYDIAPGHTYVANVLHGYSFSASMSPRGTVSNDFLWGSWITPEINAGRPINWSILYYWFQGQFINHSVECHGYTDDKYCIIFNTWGWGEQQWYYYTYHNGQYCWPYVYTCVPGGSQAHKVTLEVPDGGEVWYAGSVDTVRWTTEGGSVDHLRIEFSRSGGVNWQTLNANAPNTGWYTWDIQPDTISTYRAKIKLSGYNSSNTLIGADGSASDFTIKPALSCTVFVTSPNGGEVWGVGEIHPITWTTIGEVPHHVMIYYSANAGNSWNTIITYPNTGSFNWTIPNDTTTNALVKVKALTQTNELIGDDISDDVFSIVEAGIDEEPSVSIPTPFSISVSPVPMTDCVRFSIQGSGSVRSILTIVDVAGRIVRTIETDGSLVSWDGVDNLGRRVRSGLYIYKLHSGDNSATGKIIKIR